MKLWKKNIDTLKSVEQFTIGDDANMDLLLAPYDVLGSIAHITMLERIGLLKADELSALKIALQEIYYNIQNDKFEIEPGTEDIHSQVEFLLTERLGEIGKKIHAARSRNDQVILDIKLFLRDQIIEIKNHVNELFTTLINTSNQYKDVIIPGYTHLQVAMPSSIGLWLGAYAESLVDDITHLHAAYKIINKNPLGSAAGYGASFPIDRQMTTELLGFESLNFNSIYAQMTRGKSERILSQSMANIAETLSKLAMDMCLYNSQNFGFISFPSELTTGSSIMPHKKNPDVFELIRGYSNQIKALPNEISMITTNLPSGYHRDLQIIKTHVFPAINNLKNCLIMSKLMIDNIIINSDFINDDKYMYMYSVEEVNKLVLSGMPFRDAYKKVGLDIENGKFQTNRTIEHSHIGSIGNLANDNIVEMMSTIIKLFNEKKHQEKLENLIH